MPFYSTLIWGMIKHDFRRWNQILNEGFHAFKSSPDIVINNHFWWDCILSWIWHQCYDQGLFDRYWNYYNSSVTFNFYMSRSSTVFLLGDDLLLHMYVNRRGNCIHLSFLFCSQKKMRITGLQQGLSRSILDSTVLR